MKAFCSHGFKAFRHVIRDWEFTQLFWAIVFFPPSLLYIAFRVCQEWDKVT